MDDLLREVPCYQVRLLLPYHPITLLSYVDLRQEVVSIHILAVLGVLMEV